MTFIKKYPDNVKNFLTSLSKSLKVEDAMNDAGLDIEEVKDVFLDLFEDVDDIAKTMNVEKPEGDEKHSSKSGVSGDAFDAYIYVDGASKGNPGPSGAGAYITDIDGNVLSEHKKYLGFVTNNMAEYRALIMGLIHALEEGYRKVKIYADSELVVKQVNGQYSIKNEGLRILYNEVYDVVPEFEKLELVHVPREKNTQADRLANEAVAEHEASK